ncbi:DapH/DapD/GlmU-related protein [Aurantimonas sp. Leaf443]|uniref:DapH/DapD/GlmU-related protein n=1 Tax=Aurantimonas sp. Leaf443 TaxID=1736378 RepID=UPI0006FF3BB3|nr:DapH/DapD/GlmU-related protein [Aurantimonas sp. Leaf443]KQT86390.1 antibiotic acetyltransferase [Aurantimonas sp. Leaf443]
MAGPLRFRADAPRVHQSAQVKDAVLGRHVEIGRGTVLREVEVGDFSYFERNGEAAYATIGKFCSIAANVRLNALAHPLDRVTTHKVSYRPNEYFRWRPVDAAFRQERREARVTIGHDVWIGHGAVVMPGVTVGTGAVIGANAVVTRNVPPYTIVAGVPAKPLRRRLGEAHAARLLALAWWDFAPDELFDAVPDMRDLSVEAFLERWETRQAARSERRK